MSRSSIAIGFGLLVITNAAGAAPPHRALGLWEQQLTVDDGAYAIPPSQMCIDAKSERRLTLAGAQMDRTQCSVYRLSRHGDAWSFRSVCALKSGAIVTTTGQVSGDFSAGYSVHAMGASVDPADPAKRLTHTVAIKARRLGPCPSGMAGGDVSSGGKTSNVFAPR